MKSEFSRTVTILPSMADSGGCLGIADTMALFMDTAALAAKWEDFMRRDLFFITVKSWLRFSRLPAMFETVEIKAGMERQGGRRCATRSTLACRGEILARGWTQWAIMDPRTGEQLSHEAPSFPEYPEYDGPESFVAFPQIDAFFFEAPTVEHRVVALDIDQAGHMNNIALVRALLNALSTEEWRNMDIHELAVVFLASAKEGDILRFQRRNLNTGINLRGSLQDGKTITMAALK